MVSRLHTPIVGRKFTTHIFFFFTKKQTKLIYFLYISFQPIKFVTSIATHHLKQLGSAQRVIPCLSWNQPIFLLNISLSTGAVQHHGLQLLKDGSLFSWCLTTGWGQFISGNPPLVERKLGFPVTYQRKTIGFNNKYKILGWQKNSKSILVPSFSS